MDSPASTRLPRPTSTPRTQPSRGQGSKPSGSKNHARPLSLPRAFRELGLRSPPAGRTRPAPPPRPAGSGRRRRDAGSAHASPPANVPCAVASPLRAPAGAAGTWAPTRLASRERALRCSPTLWAPAAAAGTRAGGCGHWPSPPGHAPAAGSASAAIFSGFSEVFLGIFRSSRWRPNPARFVLGNCC